MTLISYLYGPHNVIVCPPAPTTNSVARQPVSPEATARAFGDFLVRVSRENASQLADLVVAQVQAGLRNEVQK